MTTKCDQCGEQNPADTHTCAPVRLQCNHQWFSTGAMAPSECRCIQCGTWGKLISNTVQVTREQLAELYPPPAAPVQEPQPEPPFTFRRFVAGSERAQDVAVHREVTLDAAIRVAAKICPPSESGHPTVLVYTPPAAQPAPVQEPYAWHYKNAAGVSAWHFGPSKMFDADLEASKMWPRTHQLIPVYTENRRSISDCEELAALGWQAITCPSCGNVGARGYPRNTTPPAAPVARPVESVDYIPHGWPDWMKPHGITKGGAA